MSREWVSPAQNHVVKRSRKSPGSSPAARWTIKNYKRSKAKLGSVQLWSVKFAWFRRCANSTDRGSIAKVYYQAAWSSEHHEGRRCVSCLQGHRGPKAYSHVVKGKRRASDWKVPCACWRNFEDYKCCGRGCWEIYLYSFCNGDFQITSSNAAGYQT